MYSDLLYLNYSSYNSKSVFSCALNLISTFLFYFLGNRTNKNLIEGYIVASVKNRHKRQIWRYGRHYICQNINDATI
jgi:hypothetical protein